MTLLYWAMAVGGLAGMVAVARWPLPGARRVR